MARKNKNDFPETSIFNFKNEIWQEVWAVVYFVLAIFLVLAAFEKAGLAGRISYEALRYFLGVGYFVLPLLLVMLSLSFIRADKKSFAVPKLIGSLLFFSSSLGLINLFWPEKGGVIGNAVSYPLIKLVDFYSSAIILSAIFAISLIIIFDTKISVSLLYIWKKIFGKKSDKNLKIKGYEDPDGEDYDDNEKRRLANSARENDDGEEDTEEKNSRPEKKVLSVKSPKIITPEEDAGFSISGPRDFSFLNQEYTPPPLSLLERDKGKPEVGDIKANANIIKRTLQNFGITVEMDEISIGPSVTRYALKPAEGVKLSRIVGLQNDLALALAAHPTIRIEAPIPGKSLVGIEIPNSVKTTVGLGTLLASEEYHKSEKPLLVSLGKGISGKSHFANMAKMPHLLIAGATGSGKSVTIHTIITSLLYRNSPESLKFIMIDPKRVELTLYNKIPHLLTPVITDAKKAILCLKWAAKEMDRRYDILETESVRDIESYHKNILAPELKKLQAKKESGEPIGEHDKMPEMMPNIVIIIDELADIMQAYPRELEASIVRLAQMSRAVGIHLLLSTQRPSVNVITGLIKANIPTRIALQVTSQIDSRTILDTGGAEKLLGAGDMLYLSGEMSKPQRIQSAFISESEVKKVVKYFADSFADRLPSEINITEENEKNPIFESAIDLDSEELGDDDNLYEEAREIIIKAGKASTSYLQRKLRIGYARAARLMDILEERGVIGSADGARPREVIGAEERSASGSDSELDLAPPENNFPPLSEASESGDENN